MKKKKQISYAHILLATVVAIVVLVVCVIILFAAMGRTRTILTNTVEALSAQIIENERHLQTLVGEIALQGQVNQDALSQAQQDLLDQVAENLDTVNQEILRVETASSDQVLALGQQVASAEMQLQQAIDAWAPRVVRTKCRTYDDGSGTDPDDLFARGSGVLFANGASHMIVTNAHVIDDNRDDQHPSQECLVMFEGQDEDDAYTFSKNQLKLQDEDEFDFGHMLSPNRLVDHQDVDVSAGICSHTATSGTDIIVLGYPKIGSKESITITEGVISGFEEGHYVTSANIGSGSSGGAAIDIEHNCYLGIPTFTRIDRTGSLGRILKVDSVAG